jgi:Helicase associated domain
MSQPMLSEEQSLAIESLMCMKTQVPTKAPSSTLPKLGVTNKYIPSIPPPPPSGPSLEELEQTTTTRAKAALISWYQRLNELYQFKLKYGHCDVPQKYAENRCLGIWVNKQRCERVVFDECLPKKAKYTDEMEPMKTSLTVKKLYELEKIGFVWAKRKGDYIWNQHYNDLKSFFTKHGHSNLPCKYKPKPTLGRWITSQRSQFKRGTLPQEYIDKLDAIAFTWDMYAKTADDFDHETQQENQNRPGMQNSINQCNGVRFANGAEGTAVPAAAPKYIGTHEAQVRARLGHPLFGSREVMKQSDPPKKTSDMAASGSLSIHSISSTKGKENTISFNNSKRVRACPTMGTASLVNDTPQYSNNLDLLVQIASGEVQVDTSNCKLGEEGKRKRKGATGPKNNSSAFLPLPIQPICSSTCPPSTNIVKNKRAKRSPGLSCYEQPTSSFAASASVRS